MQDKCSIFAFGQVGSGKNSQGSKERGFNLLELLVVLGIISLLAALAFPNLSRLTSGKELSQQTEHLATMIHRARDLAMDQGYPWRIVFNPGHGSWVCYGDQNGDSRIDPGERLLGPFSLSEPVRFGCRSHKGPNDTDLPDDGVSFSDNRITFSPMGCCNSGSIYLRNDTSSIAIRVLPASGVIRIWRYGSSWEIIK